MPARRVLLLTLALGLAMQVAAAGEPPSLKADLRDRLDRLALDLPGDSLARQAFRSVEDLPYRLLTVDGVTPEEESRHAASAHERLLADKAASPTPAAVQRLFDQLIAELPAHLKPAAYHWRLTVLDRPTSNAFGAGGGFLYITKPRMESLLADPRRGEAALAFTLAAEMGHTALGHARRRWDAVEVADDLRGDVPFSIPCAETAAPEGFDYTCIEQWEADRFALHLCRNAGLDLDAALDAVRLAAVPPQVDDNGKGPQAGAVESTGLGRLRRLLMERDGLLDDETTHGLFLWDRVAHRLVRCGPRQIGPGERPIVLVHGMRAPEFALGSYLFFLEKQPEMADRPLLIFHYPNNDSLSRSGEFLAREMSRVVAEPEKTVFVCHSAGGLVVRWYAEVRKGGFDKAIFFATPHAGTRMAEYKGFVDVGRFFLDLPYGGLGYALADEFGEGDGQIAADLHPDSLFLRRLAQEKHPVAQYQIFYGQVFNWVQGLELQAAFALGKPYLKGIVTAVVPFPGLRDRLANTVEATTLPEEITAGDLAVSSRSAHLAGVVKTTALVMQHEAFRYDPEIMRQVLAAIQDR